MAEYIAFSHLPGASGPQMVRTDLFTADSDPAAWKRANRRGVAGAGMIVTTHALAFNADGSPNLGPPIAQPVVAPADAAPQQAPSAEPEAAAKTAKRAPKG